MGARETGDVHGVITLSGQRGQGGWAEGDIEFTWNSSIAALSDLLGPVPRGLEMWCKCKNNTGFQRCGTKNAKY